MSFSVLHLAVIDDGRRITLLGNRGWGGHGPANVWQRTTIDEIAETSRTLVGPDEPYGGRSKADMAAAHWAGLADTLRDHSVIIDPTKLSLLPHDVELTERVKDRLTGR